MTISERYQRQQLELFATRLRDWQDAKIAQRDAASDAAVDHRLRQAAQLVMTTHAPFPWMIAEKFVVLEEAMLEDSAGSLPGSPLAWMVAGIKADIMSLPHPDFDHAD